MAAHGFPERPSRETRLLLLIVSVSIAVLLLLARLRFPAANLTAAPDPGPLAGLAGRGTFDDLAETMNSLLARVSPRLLTVELSPASAGEGESSSGELSRGPRALAPRLALALRVRADLALVPVPPAWRPHRLADGDEPIETVASNLTQQLALVRVAPAPDVRNDPAGDAFPGLVYVGVFEATAAGISIQPTFIGRVVTATDSRWPGTVLGLTEVGKLTPGTFLFSIDGRLIGLAIRDADRDELVPASVLDAVVSDMGTGGPPHR